MRHLDLILLLLAMLAAGEQEGEDGARLLAVEDAGDRAAEGEMRAVGLVPQPLLAEALVRVKVAAPQGRGSTYQRRAMAQGRPIRGRRRRWVMRRRLNLR